MSVRPQRGLDEVKAYVPGKPIGEVKREYGLTDVIKLASNENPLGVSPLALEAMRETLPQANVYPDGASYDLRTALAEHFGFPLGHVTVGNGADDLILQLSMAFLDDGDEVIASRSSFPIYDVYTHAMRARMIKTPLAQGYRIDLEAMADAVTDRTRVIYVCNPNNPTGTIVSSSEVEAFMTRVPDHVLVVFDEAYAEMVDSPTFPATLRYLREGCDHVLVLRTFSKVYGLAGIRLGYAFASEEIISTLFRVKPAFTVNVLAQAAGIAAIQDETFLHRSIAENAWARRFLCAQLRRMDLEYAESHTNFVLVRIGPRAALTQRALLERGIIVRPCAAYDLPDFLRISLGTREENERLVDALEEIVCGKPAVHG